MIHSDPDAMSVAQYCVERGLTIPEDLAIVKGDPSDAWMQFEGDLEGVHWIGAQMTEGEVHVRGNVVHTGQLFFLDSLTDRVYRNAPYDKRPSRTTRNANDSIFVNGGRKSILTVRGRSAGGYLGKIRMGVHRS